MRDKISKTFKQIFQDRLLFVLILFLIILSLGFILFIILNLDHNELTVWLRYSGFGKDNYYRGKWYLLYNWLGLALLNMIGSIFIAYRFFVKSKPKISYVVLTLASLIVVIAWVILNNIYRLPN